MFKLDSEITEEPEIKLLRIVESSKKQEHSRKISTSASFNALKPLTVSVRSVQSLSCVKLFVTPLAAACPVLPVHHRFPEEFTQTQVHWVSDAIQPSHLQSPPCLPALNLPQTNTDTCYRTDAPSESFYPCLIGLSEIIGTGAMISCIWLKDKHLIFCLSIRCVLGASDVNMCLYAHENKCWFIIFDQLGTAS